MSWTDGFKRLFGIDPMVSHDEEQDEELADAKERVAAIDVRVGALSRRLTDHEDQTNAHARKEERQ